MAFAPPHNDAGVLIPPVPANPPSLFDITNSKDYVQRLIKSKGKCLCPCRVLVVNLADLGSISASRSEIHATDDEIGAAELFHHESVLKASLGGDAAPPWLAHLINTVDQIQETVDRLINTVDQIQETVDRTSAIIENMRIAKANVALARTGINTYTAMQKEVR
jgi:hypothetical protein